MKEKQFLQEFVAAMVIVRMAFLQPTGSREVQLPMFQAKGDPLQRILPGQKERVRQLQTAGPGAAAM